MKTLLKPILLTLVTTAGFTACNQPFALAQIAVRDDANLDKKKDDEKNSAKSSESKSEETKSRKSVVCTYTNKYRGEMFRRSPQEALTRDSENVKLIRYYARKYGVSESLALSVAYQESRFDSCAGSHTGVKGVMQLTQKTGNSMGFDRDINEQNIEGGVKYLAMGANKCGETNYTCLASWYNGSNAAEQKSWAGGVGRWHNYMNSYVSSGKAPEAAPPAISITTTSGAGGKAQTGALGTVSTAARNLDASNEKIRTNSSMIEGMYNSIGEVTEYKDAWELNSSARSMNGSVTNQYINQAADFTALLGQFLTLRNVGASQSAKTVSMPKSGTPNPFSCDPKVLERLNIDRSKWLPCALSNENSPKDDISETMQPDLSGANRALDALQQ